MRHGERVVRRDRLALGGERLEQREVHHPQEVEAAVVDRRAAQLEAKQTQHMAHHRTSVGHQEHHVAGPGVEGLDNGAGLCGRQELGHAAVQGWAAAVGS